MLSRLPLVALLLVLTLRLSGREFTVLVYNVENLFDVDGVAVFDDYQQNGTENPYTPRRLLTKLQHITETLAAVSDGTGPDIILFQEFELDRTPFSGARPYGEFLAQYAGTTVEAMLTTDFSAQIAGLPAEAFLLKYLHDSGMGSYNVAKPVPSEGDSASAQQNVIFTRFPILWERKQAMASARDLQIVALDVDGHELILMNNHWKAGASNPGTEPARVQNAHVVRAELEALLLNNPSADIIVAGDLNSYYNQAALFPDLETTGINHILGSSTDEVALVEGRGRGLYNLWGELPLDERGSEPYRGYWGTLMQMLLVRSLYDNAGVQYVDNSFFRLLLPGRNVETEFGTPRAWNHFGDGAGFSDHLPVGARFRTVGDRSTRAMMSLENPTEERALQNHRPKVDYTLKDPGRIPSSAELAGLSDAELGRRFGEVFEVEAELLGEEGQTVEIGSRTFGIYAPAPETRESLSEASADRRLHAFGQLGSYRGQAQFVIQDPSWILR